MGYCDLHIHSGDPKFGEQVDVCLLNIRAQGMHVCFKWQFAPPKFMTTMAMTTSTTMTTTAKRTLGLGLEKKMNRGY
jgi:hypothetical protein